MAGGGRMKIMLHIDRLVLEGVTPRTADCQTILSATQRELARLLLAGPLPPRLGRGGAVDVLSAAAPPQTTARTPQAIGTYVARAIHGGLAGQR
jgi:hypothetical protein